MSDSVAAPSRRRRVTPQSLLQGSGVLWFTIAAAGQWLFTYYILGAYIPRTASGDYSRWNETGLIEGYVQGDWLGNLGFISHVLLAALVSAAGVIQLLPMIRRKFPAFHRWTGRAYISVAVFLAIGGILLIWVRGTRLNDWAALGTTIDGLLILVTATFTLRHAMARRIDLHRRWAMRLFVVVSGVWFIRVAYMAWAIASGGAGMRRTLDGPTDILVPYLAFLVPLIVLEVYQKARDSRSAPFKLGVAGLILVCGGITALGLFGAWMMMWSPNILI
ncbi:DUF2306 domain-containing protein [Maricaulis maris]|uniref:Putative membrane protein DUF2306 n=1 Tax=Maricaulis maris TaxID=74318 RepID=A0A495DKE3_9PROT|nr:DUF2306 domain-containing protein [Maricaulis maris]RKR03071.1 putative membrane protein DUF2306 [Maricaulis maris]